MWHLNKIPKILHVYWGGGKLAYLRYLTLVTFKKHNPDWDIVLYIPRVYTPGISWATSEHKYGQDFPNYSGMFKKLNISIIEIDLSDILVGASEIHRADYLRWILLHDNGGLWSDLDILYIKPMDSLYFNILQNKNVGTIICDRVYGHSIGFLMSSQNNPYFETLRQSSLLAYRYLEYQCMGSTLFNRVYPDIKNYNNVVNMTMEVVYPYDANHVNELFKPRDTYVLPPNTIGVHWYAGNHIAGTYLNNTDGGLNSTGDSIIDKLVRNEN